MNQPKITLPHKFQGGGYEVTVNADRSIKVRQGDWLSKYSKAIYGDFDRIDKFWRKKNGLWEKVVDVNKDLIHTGETLYHWDPLPGESIAPEPKREIPASVIEDFLKWLRHNYLQSPWWVESSGGTDVGLFIGSVQKLTIGIRNRRPKLGPPEEIIWFHAGAIGASIGWPDIYVSGSYSDVSYWSKPLPILQSPLRGPLTRDDFRGVVLLLDLGISAFWGKSIVFAFFGLGYLPHRVIQEANRFVHGDGDALRLLLSGLCKGVAILYGNNRSFPGVGIAGRAGFMSDLPWRQR